ncbi:MULTISPECIES: DnaJ family domain-containing protein [Pantoea]|jgi:hypothetical protein|uniref:DUF1992 domain-containing protein n=1 Tax=Candidatus Pantoea communis TaxID=2608354 RepID=A0ABX0RW12_9GAMM|nr:MULTISPECIES: DnaJ family domain-containing protein [Pantoea]MXP55966.1 DUF1992 domain-containing protein [Pantoea sp. Seng]NIG21795.1 DUF1992 domain-containing protein [Pantoea communis]SNY79618.1 protein of unknown function [Pantoea sp. GL120224-02]
MWLIDQLVEQQIRAAQEKGELSNLPGEGAPLQLEDESGVPPELRTAYRLLKNSGFLPPELEMRREAVQLNDLLQLLDPDDHQASELKKRLTLLEMKLQQAGMSTDFLRGEYGGAIRHRMLQEK